MTLQNCTKNFIFGALHSILRDIDSYSNMIVILLSFEILFLIVFLFSISSCVYRYLSKIWLIILLQLLRISLLVTFIIDNNSNYSLLTESYQQAIIFLMIMLYLFSTVFLIVELLCQIGSFIVKLFRQKTDTDFL